MTRALNITAMVSFTGLVLTCLAWGLTSSTLMPRGLWLGRDVPAGVWPKPWRFGVARGMVTLYRKSRPWNQNGNVAFQGSLSFFCVYRGYDADGDVGFTWIMAKLWVVLAAFAALPAIWLATARRRRRAHRRKLGLCEKCGYDLRGSPEGQCPECGVRA